MLLNSRLSTAFTTSIFRRLHEYSGPTGKRDLNKYRTSLKNLIANTLSLAHKREIVIQDQRIGNKPVWDKEIKAVTADLSGSEVIFDLSDQAASVSEACFSRAENYRSEYADAIEDIRIRRLRQTNKTLETVNRIRENIENQVVSVAISPDRGIKDLFDRVAHVFRFLDWSERYRMAEMLLTSNDASSLYLDAAPLALHFLDEDGQVFDEMRFSINPLPSVKQIGAIRDAALGAITEGDQWEGFVQTYVQHLSSVCRAYKKARKPKPPQKPSPNAAHFNRKPDLLVYPQAPSANDKKYLVNWVEKLLGVFMKRDFLAEKQSLFRQAEMAHENLCKELKMRYDKERVDCEKANKRARSIAIAEFKTKRAAYLRELELWQQLQGSADSLLRDTQRAESYFGGSRSNEGMASALLLQPDLTALQCAVVVSSEGQTMVEVEIESPLEHDVTAMAERYLSSRKINDRALIALFGDTRPAALTYSCSVHSATGECLAKCKEVVKP